MDKIIPISERLWLDTEGFVYDHLLTMCDNTGGTTLVDLEEVSKLIEALQAFGKNVYQEYIDPVTDMHLIVKQDNPGFPGHPKLTFVCPNTAHLSVEAVNEGMTRLQDMAGIPMEQRDPSPYK